MFKLKYFLLFAFAIGLLGSVNLASARFISLDPVGSMEHIQNGNMNGFNRYAYGNNNPYKYIDPDGRAPFFFTSLRRDMTLDQALRQSGGPMRIGANVVGSGVGVIDTASMALGVYGLARTGAKYGVMGLATKGVDDVVKALPAPSMVKHHIFNVFRGASPKSQKYRDFFKQHGIALDSHTIQLSVNEHKLVHQAGNNWTTQWKRWIDANPNATTKDVYQQAGRMMDAHGVGHKPIVPYK